MDHTKHYLIAEMIHGALLPLQRYNGSPVVEWKHLMQSEKDEKAQAVLQLASTGIVKDRPESQEEEIFCGITMTMYPIEVAKLSPEIEKKLDEGLDALAAGATPQTLEGSLEPVPDAPKGTPIK